WWLANNPWPSVLLTKRNATAQNNSANVGAPRSANSWSPNKAIKGRANNAPMTAIGTAAKYISSTPRRMKPTNAVTSRENSSVAVDSVDLRKNNEITDVLNATV